MARSPDDMAKDQMSKRPMPQMPGGSEHDSSYLHMAVGGKVASDLLGSLGKGAGKMGGAISGLVGQITRRNRQVSPGSLRKSGVHNVKSPRTPSRQAPKAKQPSITSSRDAASVGRQLKGKPMGKSIGSGQTAGQKKAIYQGVMDEMDDV